MQCKFIKESLSKFLQLSCSISSQAKNLNWIMTSDEKWILYDNRLSSGRWLDFNQAPRYKIASKVSVLVCRQCDLLDLESEWNIYSREVLSTNRRNIPVIAVYVSGIGQQKGANSSSWQGVICVIPHIHQTFRQLINTLRTSYMRCFKNQMMHKMSSVTLSRLEPWNSIPPV